MYIIQDSIIPISNDGLRQALKFLQVVDHTDAEEDDADFQSGLLSYYPGISISQVFRPE